MKKCKTPGAQFHIAIKPTVIRCDVDIPFALQIAEQEALELENSLHEAVAGVLQQYWPKPDTTRVQPEETFEELLERKLREAH